MYMSRFGVKNYKCLGEIDIPLTPIHVLIGENDAGKTSLLEAMAAFCAIPESPWHKVFPKPWEGRELVRHGTHEGRIHLLAEWTAPEGIRGPRADFPSTGGDETSYSTLGYELAVDFPTGTLDPEFKQIWATADGRTTDIRPSSPPDSFMEMPGYTQQLAGQELRRELVAFAVTTISAQKLRKPAHKYALLARQMALPAAFDRERKFRLDADGFGLATLLDDILGADPEVFLQLRSRFCAYYPQFTGLQVATEYALRRHYDERGIVSSDITQGKGIWLQVGGGHRIRAQQASDGAILFLGLLALAHVPDPPNLLLLEEPENGIYPKRLGEVIKLLKELVTRTEGVRFPQIIMSTHSPYVLSFFEPEEVTFLSRPPDEPGGPVRARPLRDAPNIRERMADGFYLGELWYNLSEEDLFGAP